MKRPMLQIKSVTPWLLLLALCDLFFSFVIWLVAPRMFLSVVLMLVIFSVILLMAGCMIQKKYQKKMEAALRTFIEEPDEQAELELMNVAGSVWHPVIQLAADRLREKNRRIDDKQLELQGYEEFIEAWTHEIKTPLSLGTLVLDNHREEMTPYVFQRMCHVQHTISSHVDRILYYARLHADHMDYRFETMDLSQCVRDGLEDFLDIAREKGIALETKLEPLTVVSDRKVLSFMLSQLYSNAFKYAAKENGIVQVILWAGPDDGKIHLAVRNNGKGVSTADLPFLFDKGFTGSFPSRQNATGMGLYLVKNYAQKLSVDVNIEPVFSDKTGFGIELVFPEIG